jgi:hypothetical protein
MCLSVRCKLKLQAADSASRYARAAASLCTRNNEPTRSNTPTVYLLKHLLIALPTMCASSAAHRARHTTFPQNNRFPNTCNCCNTQQADITQPRSNSYTVACVLCCRVRLQHINCPSQPCQKHTGPLKCHDAHRRHARYRTTTRQPPHNLFSAFSIPTHEFLTHRHL